MTKPHKAKPTFLLSVCECVCVCVLVCVCVRVCRLSLVAESWACSTLEELLIAVASLIVEHSL